MPYHFGVSGIPVTYFRCLSCQCTFTDLIDDWTEEQVARYIYNEDYSLVDPGYVDQRPLDQANQMAEMLDGCQNLNILDYGSGSGKFAKLMMERGFRSVTSYDPFSSPRRPSGLFDLVTAFEVVEHAPNPLATFREMLDFLTPDGALLFSQTVQPDNIEDMRCGWWYAGPRNGHVTTYSDVTFSVIAQKMNLDYRRSFTTGGLFCFTRNAIAPMLENALAFLSQPTTAHILGAPRDADPEKWNKLEEFGQLASFRWSAASPIEWSDVVLKKGLNKIVVPCLMEIDLGFSKICAFSINEEKLPTHTIGRTIVGEFESAEGGSHTVTLKTPPHLRPSDISASSDDRSLGLAIPVF